MPLGDNALLGLRVADVGTRHHPLLGSWSSSSFSLGRQVHNPGPLYFDLVALPVKVFGPWVGLAVGVMAVNVACAVIAVVVAHRTGGVTAMLAVTAAVVGLEWTMGSELLFDIWQPNALVLPTMALLVTTWGLAAGDVVMLPWSLALGSVIVQTHLSYVYVVAILVATGATLAVLSRRRVIGGGARQPSLGPTMLASAIVLVVAWVQPLWQQLFGGGRGNVTSLLSAAGQASPRIGLERGVRLVAARVVLPPWWTRSSYDGDPGPLPSTGLATVCVIALLGTLAVLLWVVSRRHMTALRAMLSIALAGVGGALVTFALLPENVTGFQPHTWRWLWPVAAFVTATLACCALTTVPAPRRPPAYAALIGIAAVAAVAALPTHAAPTGPTARRDAIPAAQAISEQVGALDGRGPLLFDASTIAYNDPYHTVVLAAMQRRGITFEVEGDVMVAQLGSGRRHEGAADHRFWQRTGRAALTTPPGASRVIFVDGLSPADHRRLASLEQELSTPLETSGLELTAAGRVALAAGVFEIDLDAIAPGANALRALDFYAHLVRMGLLAPPASVAGDVDEMLRLRDRRDRYTVAVFVAPVDVRPVS